MRDSPDQLVRLACLFIITALTMATFALGSRILLPLVEAVILWFIINRTGEALRRVPKLGPRLSHGIACALAGSLVALIALAAIYSGVRGLISAGPQSLSLQDSLDPLIQRVAEMLGTDEAHVLSRVVDAVGLETMMQQIVVGLFGLLNQFGVILIYVAFLFADQALFDAKMRALFPDGARRARSTALLNRIGNAIGSYLWLMTKISAFTAALSYCAMLLFGIENPMFWAILVFFLNFIPTIGSILGTLLPTAYALVQTQDLASAGFLLIVLGAIQVTMGNVVFPRMAGNSFNLSLFVTFLSLFVWGTLWGVTGMFLAVPLTAILVIILSQFDETKPIAILLSKTGEIGIEDPVVKSEPKQQK